MKSTALSRKIPFTPATDSIQAPGLKAPPSTRAFLSVAVSDSRTYHLRQQRLFCPGSKKDMDATKWLPKTGPKPLGHKGFKIGSSWDGYQNATSGTFRMEKCRFFHVPPSFSQDFLPCKRCDTELQGQKSSENLWIWEQIPKKLSGFFGSLPAKIKKEEFQ